MKPKRQGEHVKYVIDMFIINKELSTSPLKLIIVGKDNRVALDLFVVCLNNKQIKERDDVVFFNSNCRGDYTTGQRTEFSLDQYRNKIKWRDQTFPMSKDGAVKIIESYTDEDYEEYVDLQLSKLDSEISDLLICVSVYDRYFTLKDTSSINISLWKKNHIDEQLRSSYLEWELATNNDLWNQYKGCIYHYDTNLNTVDSNAAVLGIIKRKDDHFILKEYFRSYKDITELVNDY